MDKARCTNFAWNCENKCPRNDAVSDSEAIVNFNYRTIKDIHQSESGLKTIEWILLVGGVIVPIAAFIFKLAIWIGQYFSYTSWVITLPFP